MATGPSRRSEDYGVDGFGAGAEFKRAVPSAHALKAGYN